MDESAIEATQALDFGYDDEEEETDNDLPVSNSGLIYICWFKYSCFCVLTDLQN